ncbi:peptidase inhibitor family I36 protein [Microbacterium sp. NPDC055683]
MRRLLATLAILFVAVAAPLPASAAPDDDLDPAIRYALAQVEGGVVVAGDRVVWPAIGMELRLASTGARVDALASVGRCPSGRVCAFESTAGAGTMLSWTGCSNYSTAALVSTGSIANARTSGTLHARNGATIVATAGPGALVNVYAASDNVRCVP